MSWAERLASGEPIAEPVAVVVAHPDDEALWAGPLLGRSRDATLVMLTDGAPRDMGDARRLGFATREDYAGARAGELERALDALGFTGRLVRYEVPDQEAVFALAELVARLRRDLAGAALVVTHPYEGGHPDHDAAALAVARAAPAARAEFACYRLAGGGRVWASFAPHPDAPEHVRELDAGDRARVEAALAAHASQAGVFGDWRPARERWRDAPSYDFAAPPPGEGCLYDGFGWRLTSAAWREAALGAAA